MLSLLEPYWEFHRTKRGLEINVTNQNRVESYQGFRKGVLYYAPREMMGTAEATVWAEDKQLDEQMSFWEELDDNSREQLEMVMGVEDEAGTWMSDHQLDQMMSNYCADESRSDYDSAVVATVIDPESDSEAEQMAAEQ